MVKAHLLIADDDRLVLYSLTNGLRDAGYMVREAANAEEALQLCKENKPDLALLDIRMPDMSGIELGERLQTDSEVPFLFLSAYSDSETVKRGTAAGALGYLVKPLDIVQIIPSVEAALACASEIRKLRESSKNLGAALENSRKTSITVGLVMERYSIDAKAAFEVLRSYARSKRRKISDVAAEIVADEDALEKVRSHIKP